VASNYSIWNGSESLLVPCSNHSANSYAVCYSPLVVDDLTCVFSCPLPSLSNTQYLNAKIMQGIVAWFSWVTTAFMIVSYLINPRLRQFPKTIIIFVAMSANILAGGVILPTMIGYDNIWCGGEGVVVKTSADVVGLGVNSQLQVSYSVSSLTVHSSSCTFQGVLILFGILASTCWWAIVAVNMCSEIFLGSHLSSKPFVWGRIVVYSIVGWGLPFAFMVIPAGAGKLGFAPGYTFCFILSDDNYAWDVTFFFIPMGIALIVGCVCFFLALGKLLVMAIKVRKFPTVLLVHIRVLFFILIYFMIFSFFLAYIINDGANNSTIASAYESYFTCLTGYSYTPQADCALSDSATNISLVMLKGFAVSCLGVLLFINFLSWDLIKQWYVLAAGVFLALRDRDASKLFNRLTKQNTASTANADSTEMTTVDGRNTAESMNTAEGVNTERDPDTEEASATSTSED